MKVLDPGHRYALATLDDPTHAGDRLLQFVKREGPKYPGNVGHYPGTTTQEVLRACIDRADYVYDQIPCWQTKFSIFLMCLVVWLYEHRAAKRHGRKAPRLFEAVFGKTCPQCGHVGCSGACRS